MTLSFNQQLIESHYKYHMQEMLWPNEMYSNYFILLYWKSATWLLCDEVTSAHCAVLE